MEHNAQPVAEKRAKPRGRTRRACDNCRKKKVRCPGDYPACSLCQRQRQKCIYDNLTAPRSYPQEGGPSMIDLTQRISRIESLLTDPRQSISTAPTADSNNMKHLPGREWTTLPPFEVLQCLTNDYFLHCQNQPYCYFSERLFRQKLYQGTIPTHLVYAVLATALRFTSHLYYSGCQAKAAAVYAEQSWKLVIACEFSSEPAQTAWNVHLAQTVGLLALWDLTAGNANLGWLKLGMAIRICQGLSLAREPAISLTAEEQEEHRRVFWSIYLLDKLVSCGRNRAHMMYDEYCQVQLPCDETTFEAGLGKSTMTISDLASARTYPAERPGHFALSLLMASSLSLCARYSLHNRTNVKEPPPWESGSDFASICSSLLCYESYSELSDRDIEEVIAQNYTVNGQINQQHAAHLVFSHALFRLCQITLHHPFLLRLKLTPFSGHIPASFMRQALEKCYMHALALSELLHKARRIGCLVETSFYGHCLTVAITVHAAYIGSEDQSVSRRAEQALTKDMQLLSELGQLWAYVGSAATATQAFLGVISSYKSFGDVKSNISDLEQMETAILWEILDYGSLSSGWQSENRLLTPAADLWPLTISQTESPVTFFQPYTDYDQRLGSFTSNADMSWPALVFTDT
ncbi:hypothetical protein Trisim1_012421 [Trichoderma cf. simile WF8]